MNPTPATGRRLGRYHLVEPIGGGPSGEVFRARVYGVAGFERQFAVKRFHPSLIATEGVPALLSAATRAYGSLEHPRIARLYEYGVASGETFTAVELVAGLDLSRLVQFVATDRKDMPPGAALGLISSVARAVGYAHGRGIEHLGLCPTNLLATADGEVKVTDFGILPARLPPRPANDPSLAARLSYLAPEQLTGEPTSAASDVFALGVIAYELLSGQRAFTGPSTLDIEQAILSSQPKDLPLPRPLQRVLQRCMARSPFERFPDARALADAIDAAMRIAPLAGGKRELAALVKDAVARANEMRDEQLSGALSLAMPAPPPRRRGPSEEVTAVKDNPLPVLMQEALSRAAPVAPPPVAIPSPPISQTPPAPAPLSVPVSFGPPPASMPVTAQTSTPSRPAPNTTSPPPLVVVPPAPVKASRTPVEAAFDAAATPSPGAADSGLRPRPGNQVEAVDGAVMSELSAEHLISEPVARRDLPAEEAPAPTEEQVDGRRPALGWMIALGAAAVFGIGALVIRQVVGGDEEAQEPIAADPTKQRVGKPVSAEPSLAIDAASAEPPEIMTITIDAALALVVVPDAALAEVVVPDAALAEVVVPDAALAPVVTADPPPPPPADGTWSLTTTPPGARVFVDGAEQGKTPLSIPASADRHNIAVVLPGFELHVEEVSGSGAKAITLKEVTPTDGRGGIKVRCRTEDRYYIYVDGIPSGMLCPTERIGVSLGDHVVEIYDLVSESRKQFPIKVEKTDRSTRVRVD